MEMSGLSGQVSHTKHLSPDGTQRQGADYLAPSTMTTTAGVSEWLYMSGRRREVRAGRAMGEFILQCAQCKVCYRKRQ